MLQGFVNYYNTCFRFSTGVAHRMHREGKGPKSPARLHVGRGSVLLSKSNTHRLLSTQRIGGRQKCLKNWKGYCQKKVISVVSSTVCYPQEQYFQRFVSVSSLPYRTSFWRTQQIAAFHLESLRTKSSATTSPQNAFKSLRSIWSPYDKPGVQPQSLS